MIEQQQEVTSRELKEMFDEFDRRHRNTHTEPQRAQKMGIGIGVYREYKSDINKSDITKIKVADYFNVRLQKCFTEKIIRNFDFSKTKTYKKDVDPVATEKRRAIEEHQARIKERNEIGL